MVTERRRSYVCIYPGNDPEQVKPNWKTGVRGTVGTRSNCSEKIHAVAQQLRGGSGAGI